MTTEEQTAWYEAGLSADGVELGEYEKDAIVRYGRILTGTIELGSAENTIQALKSEREKNVKLRVLLPAHSQFFTRICTNMPKGTLFRAAGHTFYNGLKWEVVEFYKPIK